MLCRINSVGMHICLCAYIHIWIKILSAPMKFPQKMVKLSAVERYCSSSTLHCSGSSLDDQLMQPPPHSLVSGQQQVEAELKQHASIPTDLERDPYRAAGNGVSVSYQMLWTS